MSGQGNAGAEPQRKHSGKKQKTKKTKNEENKPELAF